MTMILVLLGSIRLDLISETAEKKVVSTQIRGAAGSASASHGKSGK